jgi:hypothetical protein
MELELFLKNCHLHEHRDLSRSTAILIRHKCNMDSRSTITIRSEITLDQSRVPLERAAFHRHVRIVDRVRGLLKY